MKHIAAITIKFVMVSVILEFVLNMMTALTFSQILMISLGVTLASYVIGDLVMLNFANSIAVTIDVCLAAVVIYLFNVWFNIRAINFNAALVSAALIGVGEYFFHKYMINSVLVQNRSHYQDK